MAVEPFFCALMSEDNLLEKKITWEKPKEGAAHVWNFFKENKIQDQKISFLGGISGPGGFSNLRVSATILNTLSLYFDLKIHQIRADILAQIIIKEENKNNKKSFPQNILLNSFGKGVFLQNENDSKKLERINLPEISEEDLEKYWCVSFLPENKKENFKNSFEISFENIEIQTFKALELQKPQNIFVPDYEHPPVQK